MTPLVPFTFEGREVAVYPDEGGAPWWKANDVCGVLGHSNPRKAVADHVDPDDVTKRDAVDAMGRRQPTSFVNEGGVYGLIFGSKLPEAKCFKRWVTHEVLPALRKTGAYAAKPGRKHRGEGPSRAVTVRLDASEVAKLDKICEALGLERSAVLRSGMNLFETYYPQWVHDELRKRLTLDQK